ncbi:hypothetical protein GQX74_014824 [Glossina fuscipes]|nr:hypothetical protein GQX74_014824 [Glossina fuscipes]
MFLAAFATYNSPRDNYEPNCVPVPHHPLQPQIYATSHQQRTAHISSDYHRGRQHYSGGHDGFLALSYYRNSKAVFSLLFACDCLGIDTSAISRCVLKGGSGKKVAQKRIPEEDVTGSPCEGVARNCYVVTLRKCKVSCDIAPL